MSEENQDKVPDEMVEADRLVNEAVQKISEYVDAVTIFVSKKREDGQSGTWRLVMGSGNWYARYGQIKQWVLVEENQTRSD